MQGGTGNYIWKNTLRGRPMIKVEIPVLIKNLEMEMKIWWVQNNNFTLKQI